MSGTENDTDEITINNTGSVSVTDVILNDKAPTVTSEKDHFVLTVKDGKTFKTDSIDEKTIIMKLDFTIEKGTTTPGKVTLYKNVQGELKSVDINALEKLDEQPAQTAQTGGKGTRRYRRRYNSRRKHRKTAKM